MLLDNLNLFLRIVEKGGLLRRGASWALHRQRFQNGLPHWNRITTYGY